MRRLVCRILGHRDEVVAHTGYQVQQGEKLAWIPYKSPILQCGRCHRVEVVPRQFMYGHPWHPEGR